MYKIALSTCNAVSEEFFSACKNAGVEAVEISETKPVCDTLNFKEILNWSKKYGVELWSFHLPFAPFTELDISNNILASQTVSYYSSLIEKASKIGITNFIVHPSGEPIKDEDRPERLKTAKQSLNVLAEIASNYGATIAVEDLPRTCLGNNSTEILDLISVNSKLKVCFDTNHLLKENMVDFIEKLGDKIITTHVSDYDFINERHWLPGEGNVNWGEVLSAYKKIGYKGPWLYELTLKAPKSIIRPRDLTPFDIVKNANEIFSSSPLTVIYTEKTV